MTVLVELELPKDWRKFRLPRALHDRLRELLDRQDRDGKLSRLNGAKQPPWPSSWTCFR